MHIYSMQYIMDWQGLPKSHCEASTVIAGNVCACACVWGSCQLELNSTVTMFCGSLSPLRETRVTVCVCVCGSQRQSRGMFTSHFSSSRSFCFRQVFFHNNTFVFEKKHMRGRNDPVQCRHQGCSRRQWESVRSKVAVTFKLRVKETMTKTKSYGLKMASIHTRPLKLGSEYRNWINPGPYFMLYHVHKDNLQRYSSLLLETTRSLNKQKTKQVWVRKQSERSGQHRLSVPQVRF